MEKKKDLGDILFAPLCVVGTFMLYIIYNIGYADNLVEKILGKLSVFVMITVWTIIAYSFVRKKFIGVAHRVKSNLIAIGTISVLIPFVFCFLDCCLYCLGGYNNTIIDMIVLTLKIFVKSYFMSLGFLRIVFWFVYCCIICLFVHIGEKRHWLRAFARFTGHVFDEDIVTAGENTLTLPFEYKDYKAKLYFAVNGRGMLLDEKEFNSSKEYVEALLKEDPANEEAIIFMELINGAIDLTSEDKRTFTFDTANAEKIQWEHYEIEENASWYELIPVKLVDEEEADKKKKFSLSKLFSLSFLIPAALFAALTYDLFDICSSWIAYEPNSLLSGMKYVSYIALMLMTSKVCKMFVVDKDSTKVRKIVTCVASTLIVLLSILLLNSAYHYLSFGDMFNWPQGVTYFMFVRDDLLYHQGIGILRYPAVIVLYLAIYFYQYNHITEKCWKIFKDALVESLTADKE